MNRSALRRCALTLCCTGIVIACERAKPPETDTAGAANPTPPTALTKGLSYIRKDKNGKQIIVDVDLGPDAYTVDMKKPPSKDKVVGIFTNVGNGGIKGGVESVYDFDTDDVAEYQLVILPKSDAMGRTLWEIRERRKDGAAAKPPRTGYLDICHTHAAKPPKVGFKDCNAPDDEKVDPHRPLGDTDPAWVSCTDGCCTLKETKKGGDTTHKG